MRQTIRSLGFMIVALIGAVGIVVASTLSAAISLAATALIVPGTGTPNANIVPDYLENARDYYLGNTPCTGASCDLQGINYPATIFPLFFIPGFCEPDRCNTFDDSVGQGVAQLNRQLTTALNDPDEQVVIFGYSQGGTVVSNELRALSTSLTDSQKMRVSVVLIGNASNPVGGILTLLGALGTIPFVGLTTGQPTPVDTGINFTTITFQYDGVGDSPIAFGNPLAVLNALAGFQQIHGTYLAPNGNSADPTELPNGYTPDQLRMLINDPANSKFDDFGNQYVLIPTPTLPLASFILDEAGMIGLTPVVKPFVDLLSPLARVLIDLAYDRNANPGVPRQLSLLPFATFPDPFTLSLNLFAATVQGFQAFLGDLGGLALPPVAPIAPIAPAPLTTSTLAARSIAPQADVADAPEVEGGSATVTALSSVSGDSAPAREDATRVDDVAAVTAADLAKVTPAATESADATTHPEASDPTFAPAPETTAEPKNGDVKKDEPKNGDVKKDEPKNGDVKKDEPKNGDVKKDEPKKDDVKKKDAGDNDNKDAGDNKAA